MRSRTKSWAKVSSAIGFALFASLIVWLSVKVGQSDLDRQDKFASVISMYAALIGLPLTLAALVTTVVRRQEPAAALLYADQFDGVADSLAAAVSAQWAAEEQIRRVHDPFPLPTRWAAAPDHLSDHWQNIHRVPDRADSIPLSGQGDEIVDVFTRLPSRRLVVLGRAGAGKTILTSRFVLTALAARNKGSAAPVPVLLSVGSWDPTTVSFRNWVVGQLVADYPTLGLRDAAGATIAARLLADHRIIIVLDGFDEISARLRVDAIRRINADLGPDDGVLLTSRPDEYAAAVEDGAVLAAAAVVELADLSLDDVTRYLPLTTRKPRPGETRGKWDAVLERMRDSDGSAARALTAALSTPLMVTLARASISDSQADPADLWDVAAAPAVDMRHRVQNVEEWLLGNFVAAVYTQPLAERNGARRRSWRIADVQRWLAFLAAHVDRLHTQDIAWWQLPRAVPQVVLGLVTGLVVVLPILFELALGAWMVTWRGDGLVIWAVGVGTFGLLCGLSVGVIAGLDKRIRRSPSRLRVRFRGQIGLTLRHMSRRLRARAVVWIGTWVGAGLVAGLFASLISDVRGGVVSGAAGGFAIGAGAWFVVELVRGSATPLDHTETVSPGELLRIDRGTALLQGLMVSSAAGGVVVGVLWSVFELVHRLVDSGGAFWLTGWLVGAPASR